MNRRKAIQLAAGTIAASALDLRAQPGASTLKIGAKSLAKVPLDFTGLSYESPQLANPEFFSPRNAALVALYRELAPTGGVLRTGGNLSAFTGWRDDAATPITAPITPPITPQEQAMFDKGKKYWEWDLTDPTIRNGKRDIVFTPASIEPLAGFLEATGWKLLYGLNFGNGTPEQAAAEAACVQKVVGKNLIGFQLGNEDDFWNGGFRPKGWDFDRYIAQWKEWVAIIRQKAPNAPFAGPDVAVRLDWVEKMAEQLQGGVVLLTKHHYAMGPAGDPTMNAAHLLGPDPDVQKEIASAQRAKAFAGVGFRNSECNSCFHGGQPGVSNAFASALWGADYMLTLAQGGHAGVNLHGGGDGFYSPITGDAVRGFTRQPLYFGMKFAQTFAGATMLECSLGTPTNVTAYAARREQETLVAIVNKGESVTSLSIPRVSAGKAQMRVMWKLSAPSLASLTNVTFAQVSPGDSFRSGKESDTCIMPAFTAILLRYS